MSEIKGSMQAVKSDNSCLSLDQYLNLSNQRHSALDRKQRISIYAAFEKYEKTKCMEYPGVSSMHTLIHSYTHTSSYVIRSLNNCFPSDLTFSNQRKAPSALLEAALSNIDVPKSIGQTLAHLDQLKTHGHDIPLPNGEVYQRGKGVTATAASAKGGYNFGTSGAYDSAPSNSTPHCTSTTYTTPARKAGKAASVEAKASMSSTFSSNSSSSVFSSASSKNAPSKMSSSRESVGIGSIGGIRGDTGSPLRSIGGIRGDTGSPRKSPVPLSPTRQLSTQQKQLMESRKNKKIEQDKMARITRSVQKHRNFAV